MALTEATKARALELVQAAHTEHARRFPGDSGRRQPLHVVYGGLHLFTRQTPQKLGRTARAMLEAYAPTPERLAAAFELAPELAARVHTCVIEKLEREPVEDFRLDAEDGYGARPDAEEDADATRAGHEVAALVEANAAPPFLGLRIKAFTPELAPRALRTLEHFFSALGPRTPPGFLVTLPKVVDPRQVEALVDVLEALERALSLPRLHLEVMIESAPGVYDGAGRLGFQALHAAARGRLFAAHVGAYDYTASMDVAGPRQTLDHVACDHLRQLLKTSLSGTGVFVADGATTQLPIAPHRGDALSDLQRAENEAAIVSAWRAHARNIERALSQGFFQGWDLHPGQLVPRYVTSFAFFFANQASMTARLSNFVGRLGQASAVGTSFDDAATGQGLLTFFLRGHAAGAFTDEALAATGLTKEELELRDFGAIARRRRG